MPHTSLGRTLAIANPASHSGRGAGAADELEGIFASDPSLAGAFELRRTSGPGDAASIASSAGDFDTLLVMGGDGVINEAVNGLMHLPRENRPTLAVIPMGSGNDFARTLGLALNRPKDALSQLFLGERRAIGLGLVTSDAGESRHFAQTLSFGLDAAIALDTTDRRAAQTSQEGAALFATSGLKVFSSGGRCFPARASFDGGPPMPLRVMVFAVQNGPTYGGGFRICPDACPADPTLCVCHNVLQPRLPHTLALFALARFGLHTRSKVLRTVKVSSLDIRFEEEEPPCQADGERVHGTSFHVESVPNALDVIVPTGCRW